jgi:hypothetical protein
VTGSAGCRPSWTAHFTTFGFAVLRGFLADRAAALRAEADAAIRDAYAATYDERVIDRISGHYLPMAARRTPVSASLVCDDPRFIDAAEQLLGGPVIPECPEGVLYFAEAGWHTDDGIGVRGVKFAAYFDELTAANGALRLVPGSHHPEQHARLAAYQRRQPRVRTNADANAYRASIPGYVAATSPADVIVFDLHTWHASFGGWDRLAWTRSTPAGRPRLRRLPRPRRGSRYIARRTRRRCTPRARRPAAGCRRPACRRTSTPRRPPCRADGAAAGRG